MKRLLAVLLVGCLVVGGCSLVMPADRDMIHQHALNAQAFNERVQANPDVPLVVKGWMSAEYRTWQAMDAWAKGKKPLTAPETPAEVTP